MSITTKFEYTLPKKPLYQAEIARFGTTPPTSTNQTESNDPVLSKFRLHNILVIDSGPTVTIDVLPE